MADSKRTRQVAELIQHQIANLLMKEIRDPRLNHLTITAVDVSPDLKHAKVFYTLLLEDEQDLAAAKIALKKATGYIRHLLANKIELRYTPEIHFIYDEKYREAGHMSDLLDQIPETKSTSVPDKNQNNDN